MKTEEFDRLLARTLDDERLSRGERQALTEVLRDDAPSADQLAEYRSRVFEHARQALHDPRDRALLDWAEAVGRLLVPARAEPGALCEVWFSPGDDCPRAVLRWLAAARQSIDVCVFTLTDDRIRDGLLAAQRRGVALRLITDDEKTLDLGSDIAALQAAGVAVRIDRSPHHMHHKFALFDDRVLLTGSYNWTRSAAGLNEENLLVSDDARLVELYRQRFAQLWQRYA